MSGYWEENCNKISVCSWLDFALVILNMRAHLAVVVKEGMLHPQYLLFALSLSALNKTQADPGEITFTSCHGNAFVLKKLKEVTGEKEGNSSWTGKIGRM